MKEFNKEIFLRIPYSVAESKAREMGYKNIRFIMGHYKMDYDESRINFHLEESGRVSDAWIG